MINMENKDFYNQLLWYDCDGNEIHEFRVLRFPFSSYIENWDDEPKIDPRFYCLVKAFDGNVYAISVYDDWNYKYIKKHEHIDKDKKVPVIIKPMSEMSYYEVAFSGITGKEWFYDRDKELLRVQLDNILKNLDSITRIRKL